MNPPQQVQRQGNADALTPTEVDRLAVCEAVVAEGLGTFVEVGTALATIRDERLYRQTHPTFAAYASDRFGLGKAYAHRVIAAAVVKVSPIGDSIANEAQARELVPLLDDPDRMREVVDRARTRGRGRITAANLRRVRDEVTNQERRRLAVPESVREAHHLMDVIEFLMDAVTYGRSAVLLACRFGEAGGDAREALTGYVAQLRAVVDAFDTFLRDGGFSDAAIARLSDDAAGGGR